MDSETLQTFREMLASTAKDILQKGKAKGWNVEYISWEGETGDKASMRVVSKSAEEGKKYSFYANCENGVCVVQSVSLIDASLAGG